MKNQLIEIGEIRKLLKSNDDELTLSPTPALGEKTI